MSDPSTQPAIDIGRLQTEMEFISELCTVVAGNSELQPILDWIVRKTSRLLGADECSIRLIGADANAPHTVIVDHRSGPEAGTASWPPALKASVMGFLLAHRTELATSDIAEDPRFAGLRGRPTPVRAMLAVPLVVDGRVTGMLAVSHAGPGREWTRSDGSMLTIVSAHSAGVLEKARLRTEAEQKRRLELEKEKMEKELLLARDIQMRLLPEGPLEYGPWLVEGRVIPARQVGGDYFDYFSLAPGRFAVLIADVSGKGVPAALLVSTVQGTLRAFSDGVRSPAGVIREVNRAVTRHAGSGRFVTLCYAEIDTAARRMRYVNAGHNYPLLRRGNGTIELLDTGGIPLGLFADAEYQEAELAFGPADALLLYSDGITEAVDLFHTEFGDDRLRASWTAHAEDPPGEYLARLMQEVAEFRGSAPQSDDMTATIVGRRFGA
jgi:sigma-B regulation protein RsbU (phosphoserine phosphatase)